MKRNSGSSTIIVCVWWFAVCHIRCNEMFAVAPDIMDTRLLKTQGIIHSRHTVMIFQFNQIKSVYIYTYAYIYAYFIALFNHQNCNNL